MGTGMGRHSPTGNSPLTSGVRSTWSEKKFEIRGLKASSLYNKHVFFPHSTTSSFTYGKLHFPSSILQSLPCEKTYTYEQKCYQSMGAICSPGCKTGDTSTNILHLPSLRRRLLVIRHEWTGKLGHSNWSYEPVEGLPEFWSQRALQAFPPSELLQAWLGRMLFPRSPSKLICCTSWGERILMHFTQLTNSLHYRR